MELIPAVDLRNGHVVRLRQGDFGRTTDYGADPIAIARRWVADGAPRLHIVDLDGAEQGRPVQARLIARIVAAVGVPCQVAGGLRDAASVARTLAGGSDRVVLGTSLLDEPTLARQLITTHGEERIVAALDVRDGRAVGRGWAGGAVGVELSDAIVRLRDAGVGIFAVTAIARDGMLAGPDLGLLARSRRATVGRQLIASGGIRSLADLRALRDAGCDGAILGRALYEGRLRLAAAIAALADPPAAGAPPSAGRR